MLLDYSEATTRLYTMHNALLQALLARKWEEARTISQGIIETHKELQEWLSKSLPN